MGFPSYASMTLKDIIRQESCILVIMIMKHLITAPFVVSIIIFPSKLNFIPVQSHPVSMGYLKVEKGP